MTQEWFESADFEKTANNEKKDNPSDPVIPPRRVKRKKKSCRWLKKAFKSILKNKKLNLEKVENGEHEEIVENADKSEEPVETERTRRTGNKDRPSRKTS